jgi:hypothetical protein
MAGHPLNWYFGWGLVLSAFVTGAVIGLFFHRETFLGGYTSFRRRIIRLGHISQAALGMMNVLYGLSQVPLDDVMGYSETASIAFVVGGVAMPVVCFLSGWKEGFRYLFFIPVASLVVAALYALKGGVP